MRILRGAGARGLAVLPARDGVLVRPFIRATRRDVELHLERHAVPFMRDPSNEDTRFLRTRVRREVLPLLSTLDPNVVTHLCAIADDLAALREEGASAYPIPRSARIALATLARAKNSRARVLLPGGVVAQKSQHRSEKKR
jgi:tRNA(Ile)-lysidine synthase